MTPDGWASWMAVRLLAGSLQGAVAVALVWLVCRQFRAIAASWRARAWWIVCLGLLLSLTAVPRVPLPLLPPSAPQAADAPHEAAETARDRAAGPSNAAPQTPHGNRWVATAMALWLLAVLLHASRLASRYAALRRAVRRSTPLPDSETGDVDVLACALGLRRTPRVLLSHDVETPLVAGIVRQVVLIPLPAFGALSPRERAMVIAHELAHIRRRDLLLSWIPAAAERLFFFHPLVRLAAREYAAAREAACDALVLDATGVAPHEYGRTLVRLGVRGMDPVLTVGGASPSMSALKRRLAMLHDVGSLRSSRTPIALLALAALLAVAPLQVVSRTVAAQANPHPAPLQAAPDRSNLERVVAEQQRTLLELRALLEKLKADTEARAVQGQSGRRSERIRAETEMLLDQRLKQAVQEQEQVKLKLRSLAAEIEALRAKLADASAARPR